MKTDTELKALYTKYARDLLRLTGDGDAAVLSTQVIELAEIQRSVDCVIPPGPAEDELLYRVVLTGREVNAWRFDVVRLWELEAAEALASEAPGLLALVPLMSGGDRFETYKRAGEAIRRALPEEKSPDALAILQLLGARHYNRRQLESVAKGVPMLQLKESWLYRELAAEDIAKGVAQGVTQGVAQGKLEAERDLCLKLVKMHYPALLKRATRRIEACTDYQLMQSWILSAGELDSKAFARLLRQPQGTPSAQ